jgi:exopolysaccharide production protein ExoQ
VIATAAYPTPNEQERMSSAISVPGAVGCYFAVRVCITFLFFQSEPKIGAALSVALNALLLFPVAVYAAGAASMPMRRALEAGPFRLVLAFLALGLVSLLWSETPSTAVALGYWAALAADVLLVLLLARADGAAYALDSLMKGFICGVALVCVIAWVAPPMQDLRLGDNDFLTPNLIGFECALGALLCQYFAPRSVRWRWLGAGLGITLIRSLSKTSIIAFLIVEGFYLLRTKTIKRGTKIAIVAGALVVAVAFSGLFLAYYAVYTNAGDQADTLTGRTTIWLVTVGLAVQRPWLGHGFHSYRSVIPPFGAFEPWHAHNELLQQFFTYGVAGVLLVVMLYISLFRQCKRNLREPLALTGFALLLLAMIRGLADTERFDLSFPLWAVTAISIALSERLRQQRMEINR